MRQRIYTATRKIIIGQSLGIWFFLLLQIAVNVYISVKPSMTDKPIGFLLINLFFFLSPLAIVLFFNYLRNSLGKEFLIANKYIQLASNKNNNVVVINIDEIIEIKLVKCKMGHKLPWEDFGYLRFTDKYGKSIVVTSFLMEVESLLIQSIIKMAPGCKFIQHTRFFPII